MLPSPLTASATGISAAERLLQTLDGCSAADDRGDRCPLDSRSAADDRGHHLSPTVEGCLPSGSAPSAMAAPVAAGVVGQSTEERVRVLESVVAGGEEVVGAYEYNLRQGPLYQACTGSANMGMHTPSSGSRRRRTRATAYKLTWECLKDPWMQMREFEGWGPWPYCTLCECWSDNDHVVSKGHKKRLRQYQ